MTKIQLRKAFYSSIRRGTGEAWIIRTAHPELRLTDLIINACLKNEADAPSYEGNRAEYFFRFYELDNEPKRISHAVLYHIAAWRDNNRDLWRLLEIAVLLYKAGVTEARDVVIRRYLRERSEGFEPIEDEAIIDMDGWEGLVLVAETCGRRIREDGDSGHMAAIRYFQKNHPETDAIAELERLAGSSLNIAAYLEDVKERDVRRTDVEPKPVNRVSYEYVRGRIDGGGLFVMTEERAAELSDEELLRLAKEAATEKDAGRLTSYMRLFANRAFPLGYEFLFELVKSGGRSPDLLLVNAASALSLFRGDDIRAFVLEKLTRKRHPYVYVKLLVSNFRQGDENLITSLLQRKVDFEYFHSLVYGVLDIFSATPGPHCKVPLELLYDGINCGPHRADVVRMLADNGVLADRIRAELPFDSCEKVRKLADDYPVKSPSA